MLRTTEQRVSAASDVPGEGRGSNLLPNQLVTHGMKAEGWSSGTCGSQLGVILPPTDTRQGLELQLGQGAVPRAAWETRDSLPHLSKCGTAPQHPQRSVVRGLRSAVPDERPQPWGTPPTNPVAQGRGLLTQRSTVGSAGHRFFIVGMDTSPHRLQPPC